MFASTQREREREREREGGGERELLNGVYIKYYRGTKANANSIDRVFVQRAIYPRANAGSRETGTSSRV